MIGIYKITNLTNNKSYIGQSVDINKRWSRHRHDAFHNNHNYNSHLYKSMRKYGLENFTFEIIEECLRVELNEKEKYWIHYYDSFYNGYNETLGGDGGSGIINKENIIGIIYDLKNTELYHQEIADKWGVSKETVQGINTGRYWYNDFENYPLQKCHQPHSKKIFYCIDCQKEISKGAKRCTSCENKHRATSLTLTRNELKNLIRNKSFVEIGKIYNVSDNAIRKWCDKYNLPRKKTEIKKYSNEEWNKI